MDLKKFEEICIFKDLSINLEKILNINCDNDLQNLSKKELQIYWEIKPMIFVYKNIDLLNKFSSIIQKKHIFKKNYSKSSHNILKIIENNLFIRNLDLDKYSIFKQLISSLFLISLNNKLVVDLKEKNYLFIQKYTIINDVKKNLKKFFIFFDENNIYDLNSIESQIEITTMIDYFLFLFSSEKLLKKKLVKNLKKKGITAENSDTSIYNNENDASNISDKDSDSDNDSYDDIKKPEKNSKNQHSCFALNNSNVKYDTYNISLRIFLFELKTIFYNKNMYYKSFHYLSISETYRPNISSNKWFTLSEEANVLNKLNNMEYYIDYDMYRIIYEKIKINFNLENRDDEELEIILYNQYLYTLKGISYSKNLQKQNSDLYFALIFIYIKKYEMIFKNKFYLSYFFDFRGRLYSDSIISPIGNKWFRYLYHYGNYSENELNNIIFIKDESLIDYYQYINENTDIKCFIPNGNIKNHEIFILVNCFFEIGKIFKTKYLDYYNNKINFLGFLEIGVKEYNFYLSKKINLDFKKELELIYILNILNNWKNKNYRKFIIWKDATSSAIQLQTIIFGTKNPNNYYNTNLIDDGYWRDTYYYVIEMFLNDINLKNKIDKIISSKKIDTKFEKLSYDKKYFNRDSLKHVIMTLNYSARVGGCYKEFLFKIDEIHNFKNKFLKNEFYIFYYYLKDLLNNGEFFEFNEQKKNYNLLFEMHETNNYSLNTPDNSIVDYKYNKKDNFRTDWKIKKKRSRTLFREYTKEVDKEKTRNAFKPNFIHSLDGTLVRIILKLSPKPIITIHDSFGIDILNIWFLIRISNIAINEITSSDKRKEVKFESNYVLL